MNDTLRPLQDLSRIVLDAELAKLRQLSDETRQCQDEIARLGAALAERAEALNGADPLSDLAFCSGQDARWQAWTAHERKRLALEVAGIAARREAQRKKAQRAFGQVEALAGIQRMDAAERALRASRRLYDTATESGKVE